MRRLFGLMVATLVATIGSAQAQKATGTIIGQITDSAGSPLPATVVRVGSRTGDFESSVVSDRTGFFQMDSVPAGDSVVVVARRIGFQLERRYLFITPNDTVRVDIALKPVPIVLDTVSARAVSPHDPVISRSEIAGEKVADLWSLIERLRPALVRDMCGLRNESCSLAGTDQGANLGIAKFWGYDLMTNACPRIEKVFIDSVRVTFTNDNYERTVSDILKGLNPDEVQRVEYVDCWRFEIPAMQRNALYVQTRRRPERDATRWVSLQASYLMQLNPLGVVDGNEILLTDLISLSLGYEFRIGRQLVGRVAAGTTIGSQRIARDPSGCTGCYLSEHEGGTVMVVGVDLFRRLGSSGFSLGGSVGARRYRFPNPEDDTCALCVTGGITSQTAPYFRPVLRYTLGRADATVFELGPYISRYHGRTMADLSLVFGANLPLKRIPVRRPERR